MGDRFRNGGLYDAKTCLLALLYALKWGLKSVPAEDGFDNTASSPLNDCHGRQERFRVLEVLLLVCAKASSSYAYLLLYWSSSNFSNTGVWGDVSCWGNKHVRW